MAYLRAYQYQGDPGFGSWIKKRLKITPKSFTPGNILNVVGKAASVLPIPGAGLIGKVLPRAQQIAKIVGGGALAGGASAVGSALVSGMLPGPAEFMPGAMPGSGFGAIASGSNARYQRGPQFSGAGGGRRRGRMNVANVRALRRSIRRVQGFKRLATSTITLTKAVRLKKRGRKG